MSNYYIDIKVKEIDELSKENAKLKKELDKLRYALENVQDLSESYIITRIVQDALNDS
jgi:ribosomal protein L29